MAGNKAGNQKLVVFSLAIIFLIFVLTIVFPIFVLVVLRDGSSSDICETLRHLISRQRNESSESLRNCPECPKPNLSTFDPHVAYERLDGMMNHWRGCQCIDWPGKLSPDGFGNCNIGVNEAKAENRPWCYIRRHSEQDRLCPDQTPSESYPGFYWSNFACITP